jgi:ABC-type amino acid transport substrate-binding protein
MKETLTIGIDHAPPIPLQIGRPEEGNFRGYEVSLLEAIADTLRLKLRYRRSYWSIVLSELTDGTIDAVCSAATVTPERKATVDFCRTHLEIALAIVTRDDTTDRSLTGRRLGVRAGTTAEAYAIEQAARITLRSESNDELYDVLRSGSIDAVIDDSPMALHFSEAVTGLRFAGFLPGTRAEYAIAVRKGNDELRAQIDAAIENLDRSGALLDLRRKWKLTATT